MRVDAERRLHVGEAEALGDHERDLTAPQREGLVRVPQIVEEDALEADAVCDPAEDPRHGGRPKGSARPDLPLLPDVREDQVETLPRFADEQSAFGDPLLVDLQPRAGHLVWFVSDLVDTLGLSHILAAREKDEARGRRGHDPVMMTKLLVYAYSTGKLSSAAIERVCYEEVSFRVTAVGGCPDRASAASFRKRRLKDLAGLFSQVLLLCRQAGMVKLGHVALDGAKVKAAARLDLPGRTGRFRR